MTMIDDLLALMARAEQADDALAYIVTDPDTPRGAYIDDRDGRARRYLRVRPEVIDALPRAPDASQAPGALTAVFGVPIYRREDLDADWPDAA